METSKKELKSKYKSAGTPAGVFQIRNVVNGKVFLGVAQNIPGILNSNRFQLTAGNHPNAGLQEEWKRFGPTAFAFETLDEITPSEDGRVDIRSELSALEQLWLEKLEPYGEHGYHQIRKTGKGAGSDTPGPANQKKE
jgi:hypothetical protein